MNAPTPHTTKNANDAQFLASETHPRAGVEVEFTAILQEALSRPGVVNEAYRAFHNYSLGNQILARCSLLRRGCGRRPLPALTGGRRRADSCRRGSRSSAFSCR